MPLPNKVVYSITCPQCKNTMRYQPTKGLGIKRCVYCGKHINTQKL